MKNQEILAWLKLDMMSKIIFQDIDFLPDSKFSNIYRYKS